MSEFDKPAYPQYSQDPWHKSSVKGGLTIRQQAVLMAMQGLLASRHTGTHEELTRRAVFAADAVLKAERESRDE